MNEVKRWDVEDVCVRVRALVCASMTVLLYMRTRATLWFGGSVAGLCVYWCGKGIIHTVHDCCCQRAHHRTRYTGNVARRMHRVYTRLPCDSNTNPSIYTQSTIYWSFQFEIETRMLGCVFVCICFWFRLLLHCSFFIFCSVSLSPSSPFSLFASHHGKRLCVAFLLLFSYSYSSQW